MYSQEYITFEMMHTLLAVQYLQNSWISVNYKLYMNSFKYNMGETLLKNSEHGSRKNVYVFETACLTPL
jgi:hypothetical protein